MTPDEKLMLKFYELAMKGNNPSLPIKALEVAGVMGIKATALKNIVKHLAQANLVEKIDDTTISLTKRGYEFALETISNDK